MTQLHWVKSTSDSWLSFDGVNLDNISTDGVYIIWHSGNPAQVVYIGQGDVASRIKTHRNRQEITKYASKGQLLVTWASVLAHQKDGVERFLADKWNPLIGDAHPNVLPITVNSPW